MSVNMKETKTKTQEQEVNGKEKISKDVAIIILSILIIFLLIFFFGMKIIEKKNSEISEDYTVFSTLAESETETQTEFLININTDNINELTLLPGIGKAKALLIIEYRKENGDFSNKEELMNVQGIGEAVFNKLKHMIYIE